MLYDYYKKIKKIYEQQNYKVLFICKNNISKIKPININDEAMNYIMYKWDIDHSDNRYKNLLKYVFVPNFENEDKLINFKNLDFDEFLDFCIKEKSVRL